MNSIKVQFRPSIRHWLMSLLLCGLTTLVAAQAPNGQAAEAASKRRVIEEVVVSATKRDKSVRDIPVSIQAFTGDDLEERGATTLEEILKYAPGVELQRGTSGSGMVTIRGVASGGSGGPQPVPYGIFLDELGLINPSIIGPMPDLDPIDLATVEVLKGPQGTLFGGSALAGAIRYVPNLPDFSEIYGSVTLRTSTVEASRDRGHAWGGFLNLPLGDTLGLRFAGKKRKTAGTIDNLQRGVPDDDGTSTEDLRAMVLWEPTDWFSILGAHHVNTTSLDGGTTDADQPRTRTNSRKMIKEELNNRFEMSWAKASFDLGWASLIASAGRLLKEGDAIADLGAPMGTNLTGVPSDLVDLGAGLGTTPAGGPSLLFAFTSETKQDSYELRLVSNELTEGNWLLRNWEYTIGLFYMNSDQNFFTDLVSDPTGGGDPTAPTVTGLRVPIFAVAEEEAVYADATRYIGEHWELNLGLRSYSQTTDGLITYDVVNNLSLPPGLAPEPLALGDVLLEERGVNPKLALTWRPTPSLAVLASASRGFRFGGVNGNPEAPLGTTPQSFDSDELWNYELGIRSEWLDQSLIIDVTGYRIEWERMQIPQNDDSTGSNYVDNVGAAQIDGVDVSVTAALPWGFTVNGSASVLDARTTEAFDSSEGFAPAGTRLPLSAKRSGSLVISHEFSSDQVIFNSMVGYNVSGPKPSTLLGPFTLPRHESVALTLGATMTQLRFQPKLALNVINLFNKRVPTTLSSRDNIDPENISTTFIQPRTMTVSLDMSF